MDLQAVRYAAMISAMTIEQLVSAHARYLRRPQQDAEAEILAFLGWETTSANSLNGTVRVILVSADFSRELTTSVLWLNGFGILELDAFALGHTVWMVPWWQTFSKSSLCLKPQNTRLG